MREWTREEKYRYLKDPQELKDLYDQISKSVYRQTFHNQAVTGLMNDPNGFVWHDNRWHLFYQWCPWGAVHGLKHWYHIISKDLVTWKNLGVCLLPDQEDGYDNKGVYSGSAMPIDDKIYLYYTGNHRDADWTRHAYTCLARLGNDGWPEKYPLPLFGANPDYTEHQRDPKIIRIPGSDTYYMIIGAQTKDKRGCALIYSSEDLQHGWTFLGEMKVPGFESFGDMWECPSVEHIGGRDVLLLCPQHLTIPGRGQSQNHNGYIIGNMDWDTLTFTPDGQFHVLDFGFDSYAAACANNLQDADKAILIAWMGVPDVSYPTDEEDWAGCLTLPRELTVRGRRLIQQPLPELRKLRDEQVPFRAATRPSICSRTRTARADLRSRITRRRRRSPSTAAEWRSASTSRKVRAAQGLWRTACPICGSSWTAVPSRSLSTTATRYSRQESSRLIWSISYLQQNVEAQTGREGAVPHLRPGFSGADL